MEMKNVRIAAASIFMNLKSAVMNAMDPPALIVTLLMLRVT